MATVTFDAATRLFPGATSPGSQPADLDIEDGEFLVLVGPSGCGKSTSLRMLAGLEFVNGGRIRIGDRDVTQSGAQGTRHRDGLPELRAVPAHDRRGEHGVCAEDRGRPKEERDRRVHEAAQLLDLEEYLERKPAALSGGQRQRVAMGRAIVREPKVFLMDEPLSNLDAKLRVSTRTQIAALQARLGITTVYVTHDQVEAMTMGDRVAVMKNGVLQQVDTPLRLYEAPVNVFVAGFIGSPAMNLFTVDLVPEGARLGEAVLPMAPEVLAAARSRGLDQVTYGVRPESFQLADDQGLSVAVTVVEALGSEAFVYGTLAGEGGGREVVARVNPRRPPRKGETLRLVPTVGEVHVFDVQTGERLSPAPAA